MIDKAPKQPPNALEKKAEPRENIRIAKVLFESRETFAFPGIDSAALAQMRVNDAKAPGYKTPIDELAKKFETQGVKVVLGKDPESGNIFILPAQSDNIEEDSIFPRELSDAGDMDPKLRQLILADRK